MGILESPPQWLNPCEWSEIKEKAKKSHASYSNGAECAICCEPFAALSQVVLSCGHSFHRNCIHAYERHTRSKRCPLCRTHNYETLITSDAKLAYFRDAATKIQSFHLDKLHKLNQTLDLQMRRDKRGMDALFREMDLSIKLNQDAFDKFTEWYPEEDDWDYVLDQAYKRNVNPLEESCSICLSSLSEHKCQDSVKNARQQRKIALLSCGHVLHDLCISSFEKYSGVAKPVCPICRCQYRRSLFPVLEQFQHPEQDTAQMTAVDYLSHNFNEFDLHKCWRNATKHKDSLVNGRRLENASWRKFFQMKFALKTISPVHLNWFVVETGSLSATMSDSPCLKQTTNRNKDGDVNWLYGPFHTYEPLLQLQAAYRAAQSGECRGSECPGCPQCEPHSHAHANSNHLKPALKNNTNNAPWGKDGPMPLNMRDLLLMGIRASSDPDLFSTSNTSTPATPSATITTTTQAASAAGTLDFGATKRSLKSTFEKQQAAMAPLTGRKADFFLASAAERERRSRLGDVLGRSTGLDRTISDMGSLDSFSSSTPGSPPAAPVTRTIRFAEDTNVNLQAVASAMEGLIQNAPIKVVGFTPSARKQQDEEEEEEEDVYVNQVEEPPKKKSSMFYSDDEDDDSSSSDDEDSAQGFGLSFQGSKHSLLTVAAATSALSTAAAALTPIAAAQPNVSSYPTAFSSNNFSAANSGSSNSSSSSGSGGLHRTSSHEKGL
ncbi:RING finger protein 32, partial [Chytriomyces hyalinus]